MEYLDEIQRLIKSDFDYAAISVALMIPDICGKLETPDERVGWRYCR